MKQAKNTTIRRRGLGASDCCGNNSTESGVQWTPSMIVPSLMANKCRLLTTPFIVAIYLQSHMQLLKCRGYPRIKPFTASYIQSFLTKN